MLDSVSAFSPPSPDYMAAVRRNAVWVVLIVGVGAGLGLVLTKVRAPVYTTRTVLEIVPRNQQYLGLSDVQARRAGAEAARSNDIDTHVELLRGFANADDNEWRGHLEIRPQGGGRFIEITSRSTRPEAAVRSPNELAERYVESLTRDRLAEAERVWNVLIARAVQARHEAEAAKEEAVLAARLLGLDADLPVLAAKLDGELAAAVALTAGARARRDIGFTDTAQDAAEVEAARGAVADLQHERATRLATLTSRHPEVVRLDVTIASAREELAAKEKRARGRLTSTVDAVILRQTLLAERRVQGARDDVAAATERLRVTELIRHAELAVSAADTARRQAERASLARSTVSPGIRVSEHARTESGLRNANGGSAAAAGALLAGMSCLSIVLVRARSDEIIRTPRDLRATVAAIARRFAPTVELDVTHLGSAPLLSGSRSVETKRLSTAAGSDWRKECSYPAATPLYAGLYAGTSGGPARAASERSIWLSFATSLVLSNHSPRLIAVGGVTRAVGGTEVALGLGRSLAELGWKVLLVDVAVRDSELQARLGLSSAPGSCELLPFDGATLAIDSSIHEVAESPGLYAMSAGEVVTALPEGFDRFGAFAAECRARFDYVLYDAPDIATGGEVRVLSRFADAVVLVAKSGHSTATGIAAALDGLRNRGVRRVFTVLSDCAGSGRGVGRTWL